MSDANAMSNEIACSPVFQLAYLAAVTGGQPPTESAVLAHMDRIGSMTSAGSILSRVQNSTKFIATVTAVEFEDSSQRYVISLKSDRDDRIEQIRTDRIDGRYGDYVKRTWAEPDRRIGQRAVIYKYREAAGENPDAPQGYRNLPYIKFLH